MDTLQRLDTELFVFLNQSVHSPWMDSIMWFLSSVTLWGILVVAFAVYIFARRDFKQLRILGLMVVAILLADTLCFRVLKPAFARYRPCYQQDSRILMPSCGSPHGFPSNHAANAMAVATIVSLRSPLVAPLAVFLAFLVGLSRVYVGVHYPMDVMVGFLVGMLVGALVYTVSLHAGWNRLVARIKKK